MKVKNLLVVALIAILFGACNDDITDDKGGGSKTNGDAWLALRINPTITSRSVTSNNGGEEPGKPDESKVNSIRVILFDGFTDNAYVTDVVNLTLPVGKTDLLTQTEAFQVSSAAKSILVIVNPSTVLPNITEGISTLSIVNKAIENASVMDVTGGTTVRDGSNFMMTNASGYLYPQTAPVVLGGTPTPETLTTYKTKDEAEAGSRQTITVDRVVAKVRLYANTSPTPNGSKPSTDSEIRIIFADLQWGLNVTNKKFYPMSKRTLTFVETTNNTISTWSAQPYNMGSYRIDPNYTATENDLTTAQVEAGSYSPNYIASYNFADADFAGNSFTIDWKSASSGTGTGTGGAENNENTKNPVEYCLENTQNQATNKHAFTTHAVVEANVYPDWVRIVGDDYEAVTAGTDLMKIGNGIYTPSSLKNWLAADLNGAGTSFAGIINGYLAGLVAADALAAATAGIEEVIYSVDTQANIDAAIIAFNAMIDKVVVYAGRAGNYGNISYYAAGKSYYKIMLRHDDDTNMDNNELGEFGVVRNSVYDININSISNLGYPTIPKPDPDEEDEKEEVERWLSVQIDINPWTWYTQTENL